ncbi:uncharacterized protein LOC143553791 [Bidens hawaiensis]|uniref:uncharacterized protein LOC143553791 n=1 Tax=Bidens hawaiensis TaxID=980011 RepID=UPI004049F807
MKDTMVSGGLSVLTKSNYKLWSTKMEEFLKEYGFWEVIEPTVSVAVDERKMYIALGFICQTLPEDILVQVGMFMNAMEAWRVLKIQFLGIDYVRKEENGKAAQEAAEKERLDKIFEKERLDAIVQEEQARNNEAREAAENEEALQAILRSEEKERLNEEKERISSEKEEKTVNLQVCFSASNNLEDEKIDKISEHKGSKKSATDDDKRNDTILNERNDAAKKSANLEVYVKVNNRAFIDEKSEPNERLRRIVRMEGLVGSDKEEMNSPSASFDEQRMKRKVKKKNVKNGNLLNRSVTNN